MGVFVSLDLIPQRIDPTDWRRFYASVRQLWTQWPDPLVRRRVETVEGAERLVYSRAIEEAADDPARQELEVCGDLGSLQTAEFFTLRADLAHYLPRSLYTEATDVGAPDAPVTDIVEAYESGAGLVGVFGDKTQGAPYHQAVLAAAMLAESSFPGAALAHGDITAGQCIAAAQRIAELIGVEVALPVLVDADRLYARLTAHRMVDRNAHAKPDGALASAPTTAALNEFYRIYCGPRENALRVMYQRAPRDAVLDWLAASLLETGGGKPTNGVTWLCQGWLNAGGQLDDLIEAAALRPSGPQLDPTLLARALVSAGASLPPNRIDGLDCFDRPDASPATVASQFGTVMLELAGLTARNGRCGLGIDGLAEALGRHFPEQAAACRAVIEEATAALVENLTLLGRAGSICEQRVDQDIETGDCESFIDHRADEPFSPLQEKMLRTFAATIAKVWDGEREDFRNNLGDDPDARRALLIRVARNRYITLTEAGWAWIDAETDLELLDLLMLLLAINENALSFVNFRRALFEHRHLSARLRDLTLEPRNGS